MKTISADHNRSGLKIKSAIKAAGLSGNHNRSGLKIKSAIKAAGLSGNHNRSGLKIKSAIKAAGLSGNHNRSGLKIKSAIKAAGLSGNHNRSGLKIRAGGKAAKSASVYRERSFGVVGSPSVKAACLDESTVLAFLAGTLPPPARVRAEAHIAECDSCAEIATWTAADIVGRSRAPGSEGHAFLGQLAPGSHVGRYQILGPVGRGGMGEVYAAYHPDLDRRIALKVVHEAGADSAERRARLLREARAIARLSHPNVVTVHDAGTVGDRVYIAMEFVDGVTLDEWLKAAPRTWRQILDVFVAAGHGLAAAHAAAIVHRDFKPQNVMIGKDGSVLVMDFGLARLVLDVRAEVGDAKGGVEGKNAGAENERAPNVARVTRTGALLGTPAYMAPEQFRGEPADARADQFSFCVALHEALYGARPALAHIDSRGGTAPSVAVAPGRFPWSLPSRFRAVLTRGLALDRNGRFPSMSALLAVLGRVRTRPRRLALSFAAGLAVTAVILGAWRASQGRRYECKPSPSRLAAIWTVDTATNPRRDSLHRALLASGRKDAATIWERLSSTLDGYVNGWRAMYQESCEATHVRGEQSEEVLDLRTRCLGDNLDEVRALTDALMTADSVAAGKAVGAASELTPLSRCADIPFLRSKVPLPRDEPTLRAVQALESSLKDLRALFDLGQLRSSLDRAIALRPKVYATHYQPLVAALLTQIGELELMLSQAIQGEATLKQALVAAEAGQDEAARARVLIALIDTASNGPNGFQESKLWADLAHAILDRLGPGYSRLRAWALNNQAIALERTGDREGARALLEQAIVIKEKTLGRDHPDVMYSLLSLSMTLMALRRFQQALEVEDRAIESLANSGGVWKGYFLVNRGQTLIGLKRYTEAEESYDRSLRIMEQYDDPASLTFADPLTGLGEAKLAMDAPAAAVPFFERALRIELSFRDRETSLVDPWILDRTRFGLARALWESGGDRGRACSLARAAREGYAASSRAPELREVDVWLAASPRSAIGKLACRWKAP